MKKVVKNKSKKHISHTKKLSLTSITQLPILQKVLIGVVAFFLLFNVYIIVNGKENVLKKQEIASSEELLLTPTISPSMSQESNKFTQVSTNKLSPSPTPTIKLITSVSTPTPSPVKPTNPPCASSGPYKLQGTYVDSNNSPVTIPGQKITITNKCTGESRSTESSPNWSFSDLPKAEYQVVASQLEGYIVRSNNCMGCTFHPNFWGSNMTGNDFALNPQTYYVDIGFQYWSKSQPTPIE